MVRIMKRTKDITGQRFGRLVAEQELEERIRGAIAYECICDCGNRVKATASSLISGNTKSCGCLHREQLLNRITKHGHCGEKLYSVWQGIKRRCKNPNTKDYAIYGGRGIHICPEWDTSYSAFREWAFQNGYREGLSIDRIDTNGNYEPSNCRWATILEQSHNKRNNFNLTYEGKTMTESEWAREKGISLQTLYSRLTKCGYSVEDALSSEPLKVRQRDAKGRYISHGIEVSE